MGTQVLSLQSGKNKYTIDENTVSSTTDSSRNQAQVLNTSDNAALSAPSSSNPAKGQDERLQVHETTEPDGYYPQTLDVSGDMARCLQLVLVDGILGRLAR